MTGVICVTPMFNADFMVNVRNVRDIGLWPVLEGRKRLYLCGARDDR